MIYVLVVVPKELQLPQEDPSALSLRCTSYPAIELPTPALAPLHERRTFSPVELVAARATLVGAVQAVLLTFFMAMLDAIQEP